MVQTFSQTSPLTHRPEQRLVLPGQHSWAQFKALETLLRAEYAGVRLFYLDGITELMTISPEHELIKSILDALLVNFFCQHQVDAVPMGSATLQSESKVVSAEPDLSYRLDGQMGMPQLVVEIALSSGGMEKLARYRRLEIPEVWFWQGDRLWLYGWDGEDYVELPQSGVLVGLDIGLLASA
ncbi:MAG: Uma2 family endonuclease, partial [Thermosynechococcaceae cyanobacterium]